MKRCVLYLTLLLLVAACTKEKGIGTPTPAELQEVGELELVEYHTEEIFVISSRDKSLKHAKSLEEIADYLNDLLTMGDRVGVYSFENYSVAYIDLTQLRDEDVLFDTATSTLRLTLPPVQIKPIGRSHHIHKLHERVTGFQKEITSEERRLLQNQASQLAKEALAPGMPKYQALITQAEQKARAYFTGIFCTRGCQEVIITFGI